MKRFLLLGLLILQFALLPSLAGEGLGGEVLAQTKPAAPEIIKIKKYNVENEIKHGSLTFLKGCFYTETVHVGKKTISTTRATPEALMGRKGIILLENIKKKNPDGTFTTLPPKQLVIE